MASSAGALMRLSLHVPGDRRERFDQAYRERLLPLLEARHMEPAEERGRPTIAGVTSRLFAVKNPAEAAVRASDLQADPEWQQALSGSGAAFHAGLYRAPAVTGTTVPARGRVRTAGTGIACEAGLGSRRGAWQSFDMTDGFPATGIPAIAEDRHGILWFATWNGGVCRYDGVEVRTYTEADGLAGRVRSICQARDGALWFATGDGVNRWDGQSISTYTTADGLADNRVTAILQDRDADLWFATRAGVSRYDGDRFQTYTTEEGLAHDSVWHMGQDRDGDLWFATSAGVSRFDGQRFTAFTTADGLEGSAVSAICEDHEGNLWFGTGIPQLELVGTGVSRLGRHCRTFTTRDGLVDDHVVALAEGGEGGLWLGTWRGASRWDGESFTDLKGLEANVRCIAGDLSGNTWFGTYYDGLFRYDGHGLTQFTTEHGLVDNTVETILEDCQGTLWVGTEAGVSRYDGRRFEPVPLGAGAGLEVRTICQDRDGNLWFGTMGGGLWRYDGTRLDTFTTDDGLTSNRVTAVVQDRAGRLWIGTRGGGVCRFDGRQFSPLPVADRLPRAIMSMMEDREGHLWFCSCGEGVSRYDGLVVQVLHQRNGLANNGVQRAVQVRNGDARIATEAGVTRYRPQHTPPAVQLNRVLADRERGPVERLTVPASQRRLAIQFRGRSYKT